MFHANNIRCFREILNDKTRVIVSNQLQYLSLADHIIMLDKVCVTLYIPMNRL